MRNLLILLALSAATGFGQARDEIDFFENHIRPVLAEQCYACHSSKSPAVQGGLLLDTKAAVLEGGHSGPSVIPGKALQSRLYQALTHEDDALKMPPQGKLPEETIARFREWIDMGAPDPRAATAAAATKTVNLDHWAFQPPVERESPPGAGAPIDRFVAARLREEGIAPSPPADPRTLLRRLSYDLVGLPPSYKDLEAFAADPSETRYRAAVNRLLDSPRFGERWARYWLDVARYSDTGFQRKRFPNAFHYRDWVIEALNEDMPYDRFVKLQLAGDQTAARPEDQRALGFLTLGINLPRPTDVPENLDDRIDVVTRGFLGLTVACARCHDHKYDPIPTADYYALYGVFLNSENVIEPALVDTVAGKPDAEMYQARLAKRRRWIDDFQRERLEEHKAEFRSPEWLPRYLVAAWEQRNASNTQLEKISREKDLNIYLLKRWRAYINEQVDAGREPFAGLRSPEDVGELAARLAELDRPEPYADRAQEELRLVLRGGGSPTDVPFEDFPWVMDEGDSNVLKNLKWQYNDAFADWAYRGGPSAALILRDREQLEPARIFVRGNQHDKGAEVQRRFLTALSGGDPQPFSRGSGRLELAERIASAENPLTARVAVNRVWQHLFGKGIVRTPSDFGTRGDKPTHAELLDYLAVRFVENGWSIKRLIREIVLSNSYRQSSADRPEARAKDPENKLIWRANRRRLDFEALRDTLLAVAGRLDDSIGGPSFVLGAKPATPRRTLYAFIDREAPAKMLKSFDFSNPEQHTGERIPTTVPQQALFLMNSPFAAEQARWTAERVSDIPSLYRTVLGRDPTKEEAALGRDFLDRYEAIVLETPANPWRYGTARIDPATGALSGFRDFPIFAEDAWRGASMLPAPDTGRAELHAAGGSPGPGIANAVVRQWVSPVDGAVAIEGTLTHNAGGVAKRFEYSNGVRGWIVSDRQGALGFWAIRNGEAETGLSGIEVRKGEILSFVVDDRGDDETDSFAWAPVIRQKEQTWDSREDFVGPRPGLLTAWEAYVQALMATNELAFID